MNNYSKSNTESFINNMKDKNIPNICFLYLDSKAFKENTKNFLVNRWNNMKDIDIISDLLETHDTKDGEYCGINTRTSDLNSLYWICKYKAVHIIPLHIIKMLDTSVWYETILDDHNSNDISKFEIKTIKDFLLSKKYTPEEIKSYLKNI